MASSARFGVLVVAVGMVSCGVENASPPTASSRAALGAPRKVVTVGTTTAPRPLPPRRILAGDAGAFILADEPWFSDGSGQPASFLGDLTPGPTQSQDRGLDTHEGEFFFGAWRDGVGPTAWRTDGTFAGTRPAFDGVPPRITRMTGSTPVGLVLQLAPPTGSITGALATWRGQSAPPEAFFDLDFFDPAPTRFYALDGGMLFFAEGNGSRVELFRATGRDGGTISLSANRSDLSSLGETLVPWADGYAFVGDSSNALFFTDGTSAGTQRTPFDFRRIRANLERTASSLVAVAETPSDPDPGLYFTDAPDAGRRQVYASGNPTVVAATQTHAFFTGRAATNNLLALWASNGTDAGTVQIANFTPPTFGLAPRLATATHFYFTDNQGRPWVSDGTTAGTQQLITGGSGATEFVELLPGRVLFFAAGNNFHGVEPWLTDGTPSGTSEIIDLAPGFAGSVSSAVTKTVVAGGRAWFACNTPLHGAQTCVTDGTAAGTRVATPTLGPWSPINITSVTRAGTRLLIQGGPKLLGSEGTQATTVELPMPPPTYAPTSAPGGAWAATANLVTSWSLWFTDGTVAGTRLISDGGIESVLRNPMAAGSAVFLYGASTDAGDYLTAWTPDGGLVRLPDFTPAPGARTDMLDFVVVGDELAWLGSVPDAGTVIIASDGTSAGTRILVDPSPSPLNNTAANLTAFGSDLYYRALRDGGVVRMARTRVGPSPTVEELPLPLGQPFATSRGFFLASGFPMTVARVDPVTLTSTPLGSFNGNAVFNPKPWGDGLVFVTQETDGRSSVWASDGTPNSLRRVTVTLESALGDSPTLVNATEASRNEFFLSSWSRDAGLEPAVLTSTGIAPVADLFAGPMSSNPVSPVMLGSTLYFAADDGSGAAVFAVDVDIPAPVGGGGGSTGTGGGSATGGGTATGGGAATGGGPGTGGGDATGGGAGEGGGSGAGEGGGSGAGGGGGEMPAGCTCATGAEGLLLLALGAWLGRRHASRPERSRG